MSGSTDTNPEVSDVISHSDEKFLRIPIQYSADGIALIDASAAILFASPSTKILLGYSPEELMGKNISEFLSPADIEAGTAILGEMLREKGRIATTQCRLKHKDGSWKWFEVVGRNMLEDPDVNAVIVNFRDIGDRRNVEQQLRESEERFRLVVDSARDYAIFMVDERGRVVSWNAGAQRILGYEEAEILGRDASIFFIPEEARQGVPEEELRIARSEGRVMDERWHKRKDGSRFFASGVITAVRDDAGILRGFSKIMRDVTEAKLAEEELRKSRESFASLVNSIDGIVWVAEAESKRRTFVSKQAERLLGYPIERWLAEEKFWEDHIYEPDRKKVLGYWEEALRDKKGYTVEYRMVRADGSKLWLRDYVTVVVEDHIPVTLRAVMVDISALKAAEMKLSMQYAVTSILAESPNLSEAVSTVLSTLGRYFEWDRCALWAPNHQGMRCLGTWYAESGAFPHFEDDTTSPALPVDLNSRSGDLPFREPVWIDDIADTEKHSEAESGGDIASSRLQMAKRDGLRSAYLVPLLLGETMIGLLEFFGRSPRPLENEMVETTSAIAGQLVQYLERARAQEALRSSEEKYRQSQKMEAIGRLAGGVAHDFNNLLTAIKGYSELLLSRLQKENPLRPSVEEIKKAADRAASLTHQLLAYSRKQVLAPTKVNLNTVVADMGKMLQRLIGEDVRLDMQLASDLGQVRVDRGQMEQVLLNLVVNARDAMPDGGVLVMETSTVDLKEGHPHYTEGIRPGPYALLTVSDTGRGMNEATKARLFEPFFTTKEPGKGTGLGLSMVYGIIQQSGGHLQVTSEPGNGTVFYIYLPLVTGKESQVSGKGAKARPEAEVRGRETILLAEDDEAVLKFVGDILRMSGYTVLSARSGQEAFEIQEGYSEPIDLLLTDLVMEGMNGRELAEKLIPLRPDLKVLYMSGYTDDAIVKHGVLNSGAMFIQKPFSPHALMERVRNVLDEVPSA